MANIEDKRTITANPTDAQFFTSCSRNKTVEGKFKPCLVRYDAIKKDIFENTLAELFNDASVHETLNSNHTVTITIRS